MVGRWYLRHQTSFKQAGRIFLSAFIGALLTLIAGGKYLVVETNGAHVPDWTLMDEMVISAILAGVIALLSWAQMTLQQNGVAHDEMDAGV